MNLHSLFERRTSETSHQTKYEYLYHLADSEGLIVTVENEAIKAKTQSYISTTYDADNDMIVGRDHAYFKFILDGQKLAADYGVFDYDHLINVGTMGNLQSLQEREIGIETKKIAPIKDFAKGMVILLSPNTELGILHLVKQYKKLGTKMFSAIEALHVIMTEWNIPIFLKKRFGKQRKISRNERALISNIHKIYTTIPDKHRLSVIEKLIDKFDIKGSDFGGEEVSIDQGMINRQRLIPKILEQLNGYYANRKIVDVDPKYVRNMFGGWLKMMGFGGNVTAHLMAEADETGIFHPVTSAVNFTSVIRDLVAGNIEGAVEEIRYHKPNPSSVERYNRIKDDPEERNFWVHYGTMMSY